MRLLGRRFWLDLNFFQGNLVHDVVGNKSGVNSRCRGRHGSRGRGQGDEDACEQRPIQGKQQAEGELPPSDPGRYRAKSHHSTPGFTCPGRLYSLVVGQVYVRTLYQEIHLARTGRALSAHSDSGKSTITNATDTPDPAAELQHRSAVLGLTLSPVGYLCHALSHGQRSKR